LVPRLSSQTMKSLVFSVVLALGTGSPVVLDTPEVAEARAAFAKAFMAADMGEHARLAPVNNDIQAPAPVFDGKQIPEFYLQDVAPVAEARAAFAKAFMNADMGEHKKLAPVNTDIQAPAPVFDGKQIPEFYLQDVAPVAEARATFAKAFVAADMGEHAMLAPVNKDVQAPAPVFDGKQIPESFLPDTAPVAKARAAFASTFMATDMGEHAKLSPVNTAVQAPAPVFDGKQIPEFFLPDVAPVAEARAAFSAAFDSAKMGGLVAMQEPAPEFKGEQVATAYLADTKDVADAKAAFMSTFHEVKQGGLAAKQGPAPLPVVAVKYVAPAAHTVDAPAVDTHPVATPVVATYANTPPAVASHAVSAPSLATHVVAAPAVATPAVAPYVVAKSTGVGPQAATTPVLDGKQKPEFFLPDVAHVAEAKAAFFAALDSSKDVADAKAAFMSTFHEVKEGGLAAVKSVAPVVQAHDAPAATTHHIAIPDVATSAMAKPAVAAPHVAATPAATSPLAYSQHFTYPHYTGLTHLVPQALHQPLLTHHTYLPTTYTNLLPYALIKPHPVAQAPEATLAVKSE